MNKSFLKISALFFLFCCFSFFVNSQQISYAETDRDDFRSVNFEIVGKLNGNYLFYKEIRGDRNICIYDSAMKLVKKSNLDFLPERIINSDIIAYKDFFFFLYQYQRKNVVYYMAARLTPAGLLSGEPKQLDTTTISFFATNKIYNTLISENKQRIGLYKINTKDQAHYPLSISLFDTSLSLLSKSTMEIPMPGDNDFLTEFAIDDEGSLYFVRANSFSQSSNIDGLDLFITKPKNNLITSYPIQISKLYLDDLRLQIDNVNKQCLITSFYSKQKRGNVEGIYCVLWSKERDSIAVYKAEEFSEELKAQAKQQGATKYAFNSFYLQNIIMQKDGGFVIAAESVYSNNQGNNTSDNRWDNSYSSPYWANSNYYLSSQAPIYYYPWFSYNSLLQQSRKYYADNICLFSFDSIATMKWASIISKSQYDDENDNFIGYGIYKTSSAINFLYNQFERRTLLVNMQSVNAKGVVTRSPTLKNLGQGYEFLPRFAKQVSKNEVLIPCQFRNYLCFAKIVF